MPKKCTQGFTAFFWLPWFKYLQILCVSSLPGTLFGEQPTMCLVSIRWSLYTFLQMNVCRHRRWTGKATTGLDRVAEKRRIPSASHPATPTRQAVTEGMQNGCVGIILQFEKGGDPGLPPLPRLEFFRVPRDPRMFDIYSVSWCLPSVSFGVSSQKPRFVDNIGSISQPSR